jgi:hypothetical protein
MRSPQSRHVLLAQGGYYLMTGLVPFLSRRHFERVTGPKLDWWLVQTTGVLVTAIGAGVLSGTLRGRQTLELVGIATGCAAGLAAVDVVCVARRRISPVYLLDAVVQASFVAGSVCLSNDPGEQGTDGHAGNAAARSAASA